ncbi:hypothetical protein I4I78_26890, partial [Pseudonocardia sp. KRD-291]|nr:hypothetical protein [Pseudonocardia sp. KRD291]
MVKTTPRPTASAAAAHAPRRRQWWIRVGFALGAILVALGALGLATRPAADTP